MTDSQLAKVSDKAPSRRVDLGVYVDVITFLAHEAELLDNNRLQEWMGVLHPELVYRMPIRVTRERAVGGEFSQHGWHMNEDSHSIRTKIERLESGFGWAENPPSRTRRFVTNVRVEEHGNGEITAVSNVLIYRARYDSLDSWMISAERHDRLITLDGEWLIRERLVLLDHTTLGVPNLAIFI